MRKPNRSKYIPKDEGAQMRWLENLFSKLAEREKRALLQIDEEEFRSLLETWNTVQQVRAELLAWRQHGAALTEMKNALLNSRELPWARASLPEFTPRRFEGEHQGSLLLRTDRMIRKFKLAPAYTVAQGVNLGVEIPSAPPATDWSVQQPVLRVQVMSGAGQVHIRWRKGPAERLRVHVDRGDGQGRRLLGETSRSPLVDTHPFPQAGAFWTYDGIYIFKDQPFGQASAPVQAPVKSKETSPAPTPATTPPAPPSGNSTETA
ncbi:hypothetical protein OpiT1DRAFT_04792 [Opitutaceae bacterium TAV1]|nr:hypothetical protein OpiT1DRAFT_04792 [Opitutaceae bacterium TAV1]